MAGLILFEGIKKRLKGKESLKPTFLMKKH
jgi:hypothetical protein